MLRATLLVLALAPLAVAPSPISPAASARSNEAVPASQQDDRDPELLRAKARLLAAKGELTKAREALLAASAALPVGFDRDDCVSLSRTYDARLQLRSEIATAFPNDQRVFGELGIEKVDVQGCTVSGAPIPWNEVPIDLLRRAAAACRASHVALGGFVHERLARGTPSDKREALSDLARMLDKKEIDSIDAFAAIARERHEHVPSRGYVWRNEEWHRVDELEAAAQAAGLEDLARKLEAATPAQREGLVVALDALGPEAAPRLVKALETRWNEAFKTLKHGSTLAQVAALAEARKLLDERRKSGLELIFDEEKYFYPYNPPACPPERARFYAAVQQEVDARVALVRDAWKVTKRVPVPAAFRAALEEIAWSRALQTSRKLAFPAASDVTAYVLAIDPADEVLDVRSFAWDEKERKQLARDRAVLALNPRLWQKKQSDPAAAANAEEEKQVDVTNEYRRMFGRCALAWNAKIQTAAQGHSDYMANTGDFGHFESDPKRKTPADRLRLAGYTHGGSENCSMGDSGAEGVHIGWCHSSGHHRNILEASHREMASAISSVYWTQNFGAGNEYESDIEPRKP
jgi:uncharacterized protein YkwD